MGIKNHVTALFNEINGVTDFGIFPDHVCHVRRRVRACVRASVRV